MTKQTILLLLAVILPCCLATGKKKTAVPAVFHVATYDKGGKQLHTGYGFFISENGNGLAAYNIFVGAAKATVTDGNGKQWNVTRIEGANDLYDVVKFRTDCTKSTCLTPAEKPAANGADVEVFMNNGKSLVTTASKISSSKAYDNMTYYTLAAKADNKMTGTPVIDSDGRVIAIMQKNAEKTKTESYAADISVEKLLTTSAISAGQSAMNKIHIPKQLPADTTQAATYLYLLAKNIPDTACYLTALADFKAAYPDVVTSYVEHATFMAAQKKYDAAENDYNEAFQTVKDKGEAHYSLSKLIYRLNMYKDYKTYKDWDLNKALAEAQEAHSLSPQPLYLLQQGDCFFALKQYQQAFNTYQSLNATSFASASTFFYAAKAREKADNDSTVVLALLDSAVARFSQPYKQDAGPYLLQRAQFRQKYSRFRDAAIDYDAYEKLVGTQNLNDNFFYMKEQNDMAANLFPWALNDIDKALQIKPQEYLYVVEKAVIQLRVGSTDEAIYTAQQALKIDPEGSDAYKVLGIAYGQKNKKAEALKNLRKAKDLGDTEVDEWIQKLK